MLYTKTGDDGTTSLVGGRRVSKDDIRVEAYGTVDELNSQIGVVAALVRENDTDTNSLLQSIQQELFVIQTLLATEDPTLLSKLPQLQPESISRLEQTIDRLSATLPKLNSFILPGGSLSGAQCHVARCICRRAERRVVTLIRQSNSNENESVDNTVLQYLNRLSDLLFALARKLTIKEASEIYIKL